MIIPHLSPNNRFLFCAADTALLWGLSFNVSTNIVTMRTPSGKILKYMCHNPLAAKSFVLFWVLISVKQDHLTCETLLHPTRRKNIMCPIIGPLRVHLFELGVTMCHGLELPQLVAQTLPLFSQNIYFFNAVSWPGNTSSVLRQMQPGKRDVRWEEFAVHTPLSYAQ